MYITGSEPMTLAPSSLHHRRSQSRLDLPQIRQLLRSDLDAAHILELMDEMRAAGLPT